jgi:hypothetical protein
LPTRKSAQIIAATSSQTMPPLSLLIGYKSGLDDFVEALHADDTNNFLIFIFRKIRIFVIDIRRR